MPMGTLPQTVTATLWKMEVFVIHFRVHHWVGNIERRVTETWRCAPNIFHAEFSVSLFAVSTVQTPTCGTDNQLNVHN